MFKKIFAVFIIFITVFLIFVSTRDGKFQYERSGIINASAEKIFPFISNFKLGNEWSPYQQMDPNMKSTFSGNDAEVGSAMEFEGNSQVGSGKLQILRIVPNQLVEIQLTMLKPFHAENLIQYRLMPEGSATRFSWSMTGDGGFMNKLISIFINCEKMVGDQFSQGIQNLKSVVESQKGKNP
jgi:hypothetical protein